MARVTNADGSPLQLEVELFGAPLAFQVWRVDVGRVPLLLLDAELPENDAVQRWTTGRLYDGNRAVRLAQYGLLGIGGAARAARARDRACRRPSERRPSGAGRARARGRRGRAAACRASEALERVTAARRLHDPHAGRRRQRDLRARTSSCPPTASCAARLGLDEEAFLDLCRVVPGEERGARHDAARAPHEPAPERRQPAARRGRSRRCGSRSSRATSRRRSRTSRTAPTCRRSSREPIRTLLDGISATTGSAAPRPARRGKASAQIPNAELWAARCEARAPARRVRPAQEHAGQPAARRAARLRPPDRDEPRPRRADDRLRTPARDLQALLPAQPRSRRARRLFIGAPRPSS